MMDPLEELEEYNDAALELRHTLSVAAGRLKALESLVKNLEAATADAP